MNELGGRNESNVVDSNKMMKKKKNSIQIKEKKNIIILNFNQMLNWFGVSVLFEVVMNKMSQFQSEEKRANTKYDFHAFQITNFT